MMLLVLTDDADDDDDDDDAADYSQQCYFWTQKRVSKRYQRCCCAYSWGCSYPIFRVLRLCHFSTDRYETFFTHMNDNILHRATVADF